MKANYFVRVDILTTTRETNKQRKMKEFIILYDYEFNPGCDLWQDVLDAIEKKYTLLVEEYLEVFPIIKNVSKL